MSKIKPDYWGNNIYETAMGLYYDEKEAKEDSWMQDAFFPLYDQSTVDVLEKKLRHAMWALNSIKKLDISRTQLAIIELALEDIEKCKLNLVEE